MADEPTQRTAAWRPTLRIEPATLPGLPIGDSAQALPARAQRLMTRAARWIDQREFTFAERTLAEALTIAPNHPELLRLSAIAMHAQARYADAIALLRRLAAARPGDATTLNNLGSALGEAGDFEGALDAFRQASDAAPDVAASWFNLGKAYDSLLRTEEAEASFARAIAVDPASVPAIVLRANTLKTLGRVEEAERELRRALALQPASAEAWAALVGMKSLPPTAEDLGQLEALYLDPTLAEHARTQIGFAYTLALEAHGRHTEAFDVAIATNAARRKQVRWDAAAWSGIVDDIRDAFADAEESAGTLGQEVIFLVGMPRSGSTLAEQILAAHPLVQGAGELGVLAFLIREESRDRDVDFPAWVATATPEDWTRLGRTYLERTQRWRKSRPRFTDKSLQNWQLIGAIRKMLPGAKIVDCRRDPLESCWSSFKHQFADEIAFTYDLDELAAYWRDYDRLMAFWSERHPGRIFTQDYEAMQADPERRIRDLLAYCDLDFDPACLNSHDVRRDVRTASAAQVRAPLQRNTARAHHYGALLDGLRGALLHKGDSATS